MTTPASKDRSPGTPNASPGRGQETENRLARSGGAADFRRDLEEGLKTFQWQWGAEEVSLE